MVLHFEAKRGKLIQEAEVLQFLLNLPSIILESVQSILLTTN